MEIVYWKLGGLDTQSKNVSEFYIFERDKLQYANQPTIWNGKIGLIYPSDYGYSSLKNICARNIKLSDYNSCNINSWLYDSLIYQWTLTAYYTYSGSIFYINSNGILSGTSAINEYAVRPSLYLKADTLITGGEGTKDNPYTLSI